MFGAEVFDSEIILLVYFARMFEDLFETSAFRICFEKIFKLRTSII
jgi:hypothetical protein